MLDAANAVRVGREHEREYRSESHLARARGRPAACCGCRRRCPTVHGRRDWRIRSLACSKYAPPSPQAMANRVIPVGGRVVERDTALAGREVRRDPATDDRPCRRSRAAEILADGSRCSRRGFRSGACRARRRATSASAGEVDARERIVRRCAARDPFCADLREFGRRRAGTESESWPHGRPIACS